MFRSLLGPVRAEAGCSATRLMYDVDDRSALTFEAEWRDGAELRRHLGGASFRTILATIELASRPPEVQIDVISSRRGFDLIEELLGADPDRAAGEVPDPVP